MVHFLRGALLAACFSVASISYAIDINPEAYNIYIVDVNADGFSDVYFEGKERFVPIGTDITVPLILPASSNFALTRNSTISGTVSRGRSHPDNCEERVLQRVATQGVSGPVSLNFSVPAGTPRAVSGEDYLTGDFNGDGKTDVLFRNLEANRTNPTHVRNYFDFCEFIESVAGQSLSFTLASDSNASSINVLQTFTASTIPFIDINTTDNLSIEDVNGDGRSDLVFNIEEEPLTYFAEAGGTIDTNQFLQGESRIRTASFTGTSAGEFNVAENGSATYSIELSLPLGSAGVQPELALEYASNGNNGLLGQGWSIGGLSAVSRCSKTYATDHQVTPIQWDENDRFCLNGQRLIVTKGVYGAPGSEYRTELDSYIQVMAIGGTLGRPNYFKVLAKDGSVTFYGQTDNAKQELAPGRVLAWAQNRMVDNIGNPVDYLYLDDADGHRISSIRYAYGETGAHNAEVNFNYESRPDNISGYIGGHLVKTNRRLATIEVRNKVEGVWSSLREFVTDYGLTNLTRPTSLLQNLQECTAAGCLVPMAFNWQVPEQGFNAAQVIPVRDYVNVGFSGGTIRFISDTQVMDINGDGLLDYLWVVSGPRTGSQRIQYGISDGMRIVPSTFANGQRTLTIRPEFVRGLPRGDELTIDSDFQVVPLDYNADGKQDLAVWEEAYGQWRIYLSVLTSAQTWRLSQTPVTLSHLNNGETIFADVTGDGLSDAVLDEKVYPLNYSATNPANQPYTYSQSEPSPWVGPLRGFTQHCISSIVGGSSTRTVKAYDSFGDVDGDGDVDAIGVDRRLCRIVSRIFTSSEEGEAFTSSFFWQDNLYLLIKEDDKWLVKSYLGSREINRASRDNRRAQLRQQLNITLQDINGDGLADLLKETRASGSTSHHYYQLSTGDGFGTKIALGQRLNSENRQFADINGDRLADWVWNDNNGNIRYRLFSNGGLESREHILKASGSSDDSHSHRFVDITGDGRADHIRQERRNIYTYARGGSQQDYSITQITNGLGAKTAIRYEPISSSNAYYSVDNELSYRYGQAATSGATMQSSAIQCGTLGCAQTSLTAAQRNQLEWDQYADIIQGIWDLPAGIQTQTRGTDQPVLPVNGPVYVVTRVDSSSPAGSATQGRAVDADAMSSIAYQYAGSRVQGVVTWAFST